jgi:SAM-dependent methyltransferase
MFFPDRIQIRDGERVLEVGPGGSPHPRADVLLDRRFDDQEAAAQRGHIPPLNVARELVFYDGGRFPFADRAFDYVICSHVLEHVEDVPEFIGELVRVAPRGYLEFPTVFYEYLYNFRVHRNLLHFAGGELRWMRKERLPFQEFLPVQTFFYNSLCAGYEEMVVSLKTQMFEGFEWSGPIATRETPDLAELCPADKTFVFPTNPLKPAPTPGRDLLRELLQRARRRLLR